MCLDNLSSEENLMDLSRRNKHNNCPCFTWYVRIASSWFYRYCLFSNNSLECSRFFIYVYICIKNLISRSATKPFSLAASAEASLPRLRALRLLSGWSSLRWLLRCTQRHFFILLSKYSAERKRTIINHILKHWRAKWSMHFDGRKQVPSDSGAFSFLSKWQVNFQKSK